MDLYTIALIIFLIGYGVNHFVGNETIATITAIAAFVAGILLLVQVN